MSKGTSKGMSKGMIRRKATTTSISRRRPVKQRKTFTLSPESVELLNELSAERNSHGPESVSAILDELLSSVREERRRQAIDRSVEKYYRERSPAEEEEEIAWGKFALAHFPVDDSSDGESR